MVLNVLCIVHIMYMYIFPSQKNYLILDHCDNKNRIVWIKTYVVLFVIYCICTTYQKETIDVFIFKLLYAPEQIDF